ncbi:rRNA maturation RNase YbeY [Staphylococcus felis]|uniref:Endoribonuclease YbeY n=1 Tax=Staphylococcus felis TaxID=46127 RepID=A0A3E0IH97_9STAP|nr:rRNA maturation RNase YbeY [Staphylococcus felis]MBH9581183.1 rRNA maturation RNase YbeY [Staphylococcus felis]MDM8327962.1 rRNA maturation RNase YbeY [Staphylococcus felis]MDQ7192426.1 rRNA maturation RNase YbeY [Staphylococcus felis]REH75323.1 rRNA maturation RNase YbeY [Staphylococcus felis]REH79458.1 rRNA maturation RNase YbeY [Staphylococcus felis]
MFTIDFSDHTQNVDPKWYEHIRELLNFAKTKEGISEDAELSVTFVDEEEIQAINKEYRNKDRVTDVISFAFEEQEELFEGVDLPRVLGDIIICTDVAKAQANEYNHSFERELGFLALHGFLHLLGYDHMNDEEEREMFGRQKIILNEFGLTRDS